MGRKKKIVEEKQEQETTISVPNTSFAYSGKVNVSLKKGNKVCFTKQFKNNGRWPLFYFLNICLRGDYSVADAYRPRYIDLFDFDKTGQPVPNIVEDAPDDTTKIAYYFNNNNAVSVIAYPYMSSPDVNLEWEGKQIGSCNIVYKFTIPFTQIVKKQGKASAAIEGFALYAQPTSNADDPSALDNISNPCIYVFLNDGNELNPKVINLLQGLEGQQLGDEYNLYIEWTLTIQNK